MFKRQRVVTNLIALGWLVMSVPSAEGQVGAHDGIKDPNLATAEELVLLPHLDAALAKAIVAARPILEMTALDALLAKSLSAEQRGELYVKLFQPIDLNTASREEILLVPGVGKRMAHEFEEYRPYKGLAQFRREIGKYVDAAALSKLEQYVFVPIDLNTADDAAILSIPGVGKRMLHEFKEYRPYKSLEQFEREIGKYVDKSELARLKRYVVVG